MGIIISLALSGICVFASFILFIVVLIKLFTKEGVLKGILGIICGIYTFIWGWFKHKELKLTKIMAIWTGAIVIPIIVQFIFASSGILMMVNAIKSGTLSGPPQVSVQQPVKRRPIKPPPKIPAKETAKKISQKPVIKAATQPSETAKKPIMEKKPPRDESVNYDFEMERVTRLLKQDPKNADALYNKGWLDEYKGEVQAAEEGYAKVIEIDKRHTNAYFNRGLLFVKAKKYEQAINDFSQVIQLNPQSVDALCNRGNAYFQSGKADLALDDYNKAINLNPNDADIYYNRGMVYLAQGKKEKAMVDFRKAANLGQARADKYLKGSD